MEPDVQLCVNAAWIATGLYWAVSALRSKSAHRREPAFSSLAHMAVMGAAFFLLFNHRAHYGLLGERFVTDDTWVGWIGAGLTLSGCAVAIWARTVLGANWSGTVTIKRGHELVRSGPYEWVRHPIYSGLLLGMAGMCLALGEVRGVLALALAFTAWISKTRTEEQFMSEQFGSEYERYRRQVKRLIPFVL